MQFLEQRNEAFKQRLNLLEEEIKEVLIYIIKQKQQVSRFRNSLCIPVVTGNYVELVLESKDKLVFLDRQGYEYDIYPDCNNWDLIEIIEKQT